MSLTLAEINHLKPKLSKNGQLKGVSRYDGNYLYIFVGPNGKKRFKIKYEFAGKSNIYTVGTFPEISLSQAREEALRVKNMIKRGLDPNKEKANLKAAQIRPDEADLFKNIANEWFITKKSNMTETHKGHIMGRLKNYIFPYIGNKSIKEISRKDIINIVENGKSKNIIETTKRVIGIIREIFKYAIVLGRTESDITYALDELLPASDKEHYSAITQDTQRLGEILNLFRTYNKNGDVSSIVASTLLQIGPMLFQRPSELRKAKWKEINFTTAEWRYFVTKTKTNHIVPLSKQAVALLKKLKKYTGDSEFVFPNRNSDSREVSNSTVHTLYRRLGIQKEEQCEHGWRATARTILDENLHYPIPQIEMQLAHVVVDTNGRAYNRTVYLEARKTMMQAWSDFLEELANNPNIDIKELEKKYSYKY